MTQDLFRWLSGDLSPSGRVWSALAPALLLGSYFLLGVVAYVVRRLMRGRFRDAEIEARGTSFLLGAEARAYFAWVTQPIWILLARLQVPPNAITTLSVLLAAASGVSVAFGRFALAGWLYLFSGVCDFLDGRLARSTRRATRAGAALDSTLDRYAEAAVLFGCAWFYRESWVLIAVLGTFFGSMMVSYVRARGEGLGVDVKVGLMQRPERLVLLGVSMAFAPVIEVLIVPRDPAPMHRLAAFALVLLAVGSNITALRRLVHVLKALAPETHQRVLSLGRGTLARTIVSATVATLVDFVVVVLLVSLMGVRPYLGTAIGCVAGGITNYTINRLWAFGSANERAPEVMRYTLVSATSAFLNSGGVAVMLFVPGLDYRIAWAIVRAAVFIGWNYPLQRDFVFNERAPSSPSPELHSADGVA
ncbi:MAG: GtrA family protein [Deltaproteobacteria bacterium]|nr:GtrA family protein [Deltaproteobacteria bacterium]